MFQSVPLSSKLGALALAGSGALLGGAYYFQYVQGLAPCDLCFWQRYPHMVAIAAGLAAARLEVARELELASTLGVQVIAKGDPQYPALLAQLPDSPWVGRGPTSLWKIWI